MNNRKRYIYSLLANEEEQGNFIKTTMSSYDFIAQNYYTMSKEELKDIILELDYEISRSMDGSYASVAEELKDRWEIYTADEQAFGVGDVVTYDNDSSQAVLVVRQVIQNEDNTYSYVVENADKFTKTIKQDDLQEA